MNSVVPPTDSSLRISLWRRRKSSNSTALLPSSTRKTRKRSPRLMKAFGTRKLGEPSRPKKSASGCPSGLPPPLHSPPTTKVGASGAPVLPFRWATMADRTRRFRWFAEFHISCLAARLSPEPFEHYLPQACPDAVVRLLRRLGSRCAGIFYLAFVAHAFAVLPLRSCPPCLSAQPDAGYGMDLPDGWHVRLQAWRPGRLTGGMGCVPE